MKNLFVISKTPVKISVAWRNAREMFRLKGAFKDEFLPHAVIGREINVLKKLTIQKRINLSCHFGGINLKFHALPLLRSCEKWQEHEREQDQI